MPSKTKGRRPTRTTYRPPAAYYAPYTPEYDEGRPRRPADLSALARFFWWCHRNRVELAPPATAGLLFTTAATMYKTHNPAIGVLIGAATTGLTWWVAGKKWDREEERLFARIVATAASLWLIAACIVGPVNPVVFWALVLGTIAGAVPWYKHKLVRPHEKNALLEEWAARWVEIRDRLGLPGSRIVEATGDENYAELTLQLVKGVQTFADVQPLEERIAGALDLPKKAIKVRDMRKVNASRVTLVYSKVSVIDEIVRWADLAPMVANTVMKPVTLGRSESGGWKQVSPLGHWMIIGQTRAGKSTEVHNLMAHLTSAEDAVIFFIDLKGGSVAGRWAECIDWPATTITEAVTLMESVNRMIDARAATADVGSGDGDQLIPTPERPAVFIVFDECAEGIGVSNGGRSQSEKTRLTGLVESVARRGAAMNFYLVLSGQDGSLETFGTEKLRGNLTKRMCFRVSKSDSAQYVLDGYSKLPVKELEDGQFFYHERTDDPVPVRGPWMTHPDDPMLPQQIARKNAARRPALDAATAQGGGDAYANRWDRAPDRFRRARGIDTAPAPAPVAVSVPQGKEDPMTQQHDPSGAYERAVAVEAEAGIGTAPVVSFEDLKRARETGRLNLADDLDRVTDLFCQLVANAPLDGIKAQVLYESLGVSRTWSNDRLTLLKSRGLVERVSYGYWRAADGVSAADLRASLDAWTTERRERVPANA